MKKIALPIVVLALLGLAFTQPSAILDKVNFKTDVSQSVIVPCANETIAFDGALHVQGHLNENANGIHGKLHFNLSNLKGEGTSGTSYVAQAVGNGSLNVNFNGANNGTVVVNFHVNGKGSAPKLKGHANLHLTQNANGDFTATVANVKVSCR